METVDRIIWAHATQGKRMGVLVGVRLADLCDRGSGGAVFLVHAESLRQAPGR
jgi:hypothetical protein